MSNETDTKILSDEDKRAALRDKIDAAEQRNAERSVADMAKDAADTVTDFAKRHPLATVAGAIGLGLAIGAMTRPGRRLGPPAAPSGCSLVGSKNVAPLRQLHFPNEKRKFP